MKASVFVLLLALTGPAAAQSLMADPPKALLCKVEWRRYSEQFSGQMMRLLCNEERFSAALLKKPFGWEGVVTCQGSRCGTDNVTIFTAHEIEAQTGLRCEEFGNSIPRKWDCKIDPSAAEHATWLSAGPDAAAKFAEMRVRTLNCYGNSAARLDDARSDARTIADAVRGQCRNEELAEIETVARSSRDEAANLLKMREQSFVSEALQVVLQRRTFQKR